MPLRDDADWPLRSVRAERDLRRARARRRSPARGGKRGLRIEHTSTSHDVSISAHRAPSESCHTQAHSRSASSSSVRAARSASAASRSSSARMTPAMAFTHATKSASDSA